MLQTLLAKVIGTQNERELKHLRPIVARINELESGVRGLSDGALTGRTQSTVGLYLDDSPIIYNAPNPDLPTPDSE